MAKIPNNMRRSPKKDGWCVITADGLVAWPNDPNASLGTKAEATLKAALIPGARIEHVTTYDINGA